MLESITEDIEKLATTVKDEGIKQAYTRSKNVIRSRFINSPYYRNYKNLEARFFSSVILNPVQLVYINPDRVNYFLLESEQTDYNYREEIEKECQDLYQNDKARFKRRKNIGKILEGEWDKHKRDWRNHDLYNSIKEVYVNGKDWIDTGFIQLCLQRILRGYCSYGYKTKEAFINNRIPYMEYIHENMKDEGYQTQDESSDDHRTKNVFHEISVNIGRNGEVIFNNASGQHRLSFAKILGIEKVPMIVVVWHKQYIDWLKENTDIDRITPKTAIQPILDGRDKAINQEKK